MKVNNINKEPIGTLIVNHINKKFNSNTARTITKKNPVLISAAAALAIEAAALIKKNDKTEKEQK